MTQVLVVALGPVRSPLLEAITAARALGSPTVLSLVAVDEPALADLARAGVERVLVAELPSPASAVAGRAVATAAEAIGASAVLVPSSFTGKEVAAHAAYLLGAGLLIDVASLHWVHTDEARELHGSKRVFAGSWDTTCAVTTPVAVATIPANAVLATITDEVSVAVEQLQVDATAPAGLQLVSQTVHAHDQGRPELAEAAVVVAGGRGTEGDFDAVNELADALGAAVGTTRDCVDEGWQEHDAQIGQTGVTIAPRLYIGAGISGAPHHHGGMQAAATIIAVNIDADAPLVQIADFAVIGDLQEILPAAAAALRQPS